MALILDENFVTGIPVGFGVPRSESGTVGVSYNAPLQAVNLSNASALGFWDIVAAPLLPAGEVELDLELVSDAAGIRHTGLWLPTGEVPESNGVRFAHHTASYASSFWGGPSLFATEYDSAVVAASGLGFGLASRRIIHARWDLSNHLLNLELGVDGITLQSRSAPFQAVRVGVFLYGCSVRVHRIRVWDSPVSPLHGISCNAFNDSAGRLSLLPSAAQAGAPVGASMRGPMLKAKDIYFGGTGRIVGTVKEKGTPANVPLHRRVVLIDERSRMAFRETWSDAITGAYEFGGVAMARPYTVLAYDYTGAFRAVLADRILAELMT